MLVILIYMVSDRTQCQEFSGQRPIKASQKLANLPERKNKQERMQCLYINEWGQTGCWGWQRRTLSQDTTGLNRRRRSL